MPTAKQKQPLVSVIMPVYNYELYIDQALDSIVNQTYKNLEIIVVDDGSTDKSWERIQAYAKKDSRIKPIRNKVNSKIVASLNNAIRASTGTYLARMDGDDERELDSIEAQVAFLQKNPQVVMVGGAVSFCDSNMQHMNYRKYPETDQEIRQKIFRYSPFCHASIVMRAEALDVDPYRLNWAEDYDLYFRLASKGKLANMDKVLYRVRTHKVSVSQSKARYQERLTLYIRLKAVYEYGFTMTRADKLYMFAQLTTMYLMPPRFRFWLFNKVRAIAK